MRAAGWTEAHWRFAQGLQSAWPSQAYAGRAHVGLGWAWLLTETGAALPNRGNFIPGPLGRPDKAQGALPSRGSSQDQQGSAGGPSDHRTKMFFFSLSSLHSQGTCCHQPQQRFLISKKKAYLDSFPLRYPFMKKKIMKSDSIRLIFFLCVCVCSVAQSCQTLYVPMDYSLPDSSVLGIFQARILKWIAIS